MRSDQPIDSRGFIRSSGSATASDRSGDGRRGQRRRLGSSDAKDARISCISCAWNSGSRGKFECRPRPASCCRPGRAGTADRRTPRRSAPRPAWPGRRDRRDPGRLPVVGEAGSPSAVRRDSPVAAPEVSPAHVGVTPARASGPAPRILDVAGVRSGSPSRRATAAKAPAGEVQREEPRVQPAQHGAEGQQHRVPGRAAAGPSNAAIEITVPWLCLASTTRPAGGLGRARHRRRPAAARPTG